MSIVCHGLSSGALYLLLYRLAYLMEYFIFSSVVCLIFWRALSSPLSSGTVSSASYSLEFFILSSACSGHLSLSPAAKGDFLVPHACTVTRQNGAFSSVGPSVWNDYPSDLHTLPPDLSISFHKALKTFLFGRVLVWSASE